MTKQRFHRGECFLNAWRWAEAHRDEYKSLRIVHGFPWGYLETGQLPRVYGPCAHAWLEWKGWCYEPAGRRKMRKREFYALHRLDDKLCRRYTFLEAAKKISETHHPGPWHEIPPDVIWRPPRVRKRKSDHETHDSDQ